MKFHTPSSDTLTVEFFHLCRVEYSVPDVCGQRASHPTFQQAMPPMF